MTQPGIKPRSPGPLVNTLPICMWVESCVKGIENPHMILILSFLGFIEVQSLKRKVITSLMMVFE